jgi:predicted extracellular nuclease
MLERRLLLAMALCAALAGPRPGAASSLAPTSGLRIHDIQGAGHVSPYARTPVADVPGIVTARRSNGFYLQDPEPDADPATSEALFVFTSSVPTVAVGDAVLVGGAVAEFRPGGAGSSTNLTITEITGPSIRVVSSGNALPAPTIIGSGGRVPPTTIVEDDATGDTESTGVFDPDSDGLDFYESLEAMRVQVNDAVVVGPTHDFGSNRELYVLADSGSGAGVRTPRGGILVRADDFNPERIILNDLLTDGPKLPNADVADGFPGALVGFVDYSLGNYSSRSPACRRSRRVGWRGPSCRHRDPTSSPWAPSTSRTSTRTTRPRSWPAWRP